jgi:predicted transcriptional regulator
MNVLLSIKPEYVKRIITGKKKYEFRKVNFRNRHIDTVFIYTTAPVKKIVGYFKVGKIIVNHPRILWQKFKNFSGVDEEDFFSYFNGKDKGVAIKIKDPVIFKKPIDPKDYIPNFTPPQSFRYVDKHILPFCD